MLFVSLFIKSAVIIFCFVGAGEGLYALYYRNKENRFDEQNKNIKNIWKERVNHMSTTMSWMIGVLAVMAAYGIASFIGYRKAQERESGTTKQLFFWGAALVDDKK